jgi:excisionase family DNA binding protein
MPMIGTTEAARRLRVTARRVAAMIEQGLIKAEKIGKTWIMDEEAVSRLSRIKRVAGRPRKKRKS